MLLVLPRTHEGHLVEPPLVAIQVVLKAGARGGQLRNPLVVPRQPLQIVGADVGRRGTEFLLMVGLQPGGRGGLARLGLGLDLVQL